MVPAFVVLWRHRSQKRFLEVHRTFIDLSACNLAITFSYLVRKAGSCSLCNRSRKFAIIADGETWGAIKGLVIRHRPADLFNMKVTFSV